MLVAPHGGRRDAARRPWGSTPLKMNDLHTGPLARELAARLGASALINEAGDRNDVDLNRLSAVHDAAPQFLEALTALVDDGLQRHPRLCVLMVHGWNVVQPAVDIGLGVRPSPATLVGGGESAVSERFAASALPRLAARLAAHGIAATPGLRYPARARENLLQVFTGRYRTDERPPVSRLARLAERVDALQLELSLPLRLPGTWRDAFVDACAAAFGDDGAAEPHAWPAWITEGPQPTESLALELVAPGLSGLAAIDPHGGRLLLFPDDGRLLTFTGERVGRHDADRVAGLRVTLTATGEVELAYDGPMLAFPDTTPFVDLERGLATAGATQAEVRLRLTPSHGASDEACPFGRVDGYARIGAMHHQVAGHGVRSRREVGFAARPRAALRLADGTVFVARGADGILCRDGTHVPLTRCTIRDDGASAEVTVAAADGTQAQVAVEIAHRLPVVPGVPGADRIVFVSCRHGGAPAGWLTL